MAAGQQGNPYVVPQASRALEQLKWQAAQQIGVPVPPDGYMGDLPSRVNGAIGGHMVRRMIELAEQQLAARPGAAR